MSLNFKSFLPKKAAYKGGKSKPTPTNGQKIYKLSSNENMLGSSPKALAAIQAQVATLNEYPDYNDGKFRAALEKFYEGKLQANQFITNNSGVANIELITRAFLEKGSECIFSNPAFGPYRGFPKKVGAKSIDIPLIGENFQLDVEGILNAINEKTSLVFVTNPNNPTGTHLPKTQIDALIEGLPGHVVLLYDEVYYQYVDAEDYVRALPYVQAGKNVIGINSFSKAYGLAGLRVGYAYSTPKISAYLQQYRRPFMINSLSMSAAIAALEDTEFIQQTVELIHQEKPYLYAELNQLGVKYWKTQANFLLIKPDMETDVFEAKMLEAGIMVRQAASFGAPGCVRVTIGTREANAAFVAALQRII